MSCWTRRAVKWVSQYSLYSAYYYLFHLIPSSSDEQRAAHHACEIPFVFHVLEAEDKNY